MLTCSVSLRHILGNNINVYIIYVKYYNNLFGERQSWHYAEHTAHKFAGSCLTVRLALASCCSRPRLAGSISMAHQIQHFWALGMFELAVISVTTARQFYLGIKHKLRLIWSNFHIFLLIWSRKWTMNCKNKKPFTQYWIAKGFKTRKYRDNF